MLVVAVIVAVVVFLIWKRRRSYSDDSKSDLKGIVIASRLGGGSFSDVSVSLNHYAIIPDEWKVYKGDWKGTAVALKLHNDAKYLEQEALLLRYDSFSLGSIISGSWTIPISSDILASSAMITGIILSPNLSPVEMCYNWCRMIPQLPLHR